MTARELIPREMSQSLTAKMDELPSVEEREYTYKYLVSYWQKHEQEATRRRRDVKKTSRSSTWNQRQRALRPGDTVAPKSSPGTASTPRKWGASNPPGVLPKVAPNKEKEPALVFKPGGIDFAVPATFYGEVNTLDDDSNAVWVERNVMGIVQYNISVYVTVQNGEISTDSQSYIPEEFLQLSKNSIFDEGKLGIYQAISAGSHSILNGDTKGSFVHTPDSVDVHIEDSNLNASRCHEPMEQKHNLAPNSEGFQLEPPLEKNQRDASAERLGRGILGKRQSMTSLSDRLDRLIAIAEHMLEHPLLRKFIPLTEEDNADKMSH